MLDKNKKEKIDPISPGITAIGSQKVPNKISPGIKLIKYLIVSITH